MGSVERKGHKPRPNITTEKPIDRLIVILYVTYAYAELSICICCPRHGRSGQRRQVRLVCQFGRNG